MNPEARSALRDLLGRHEGLNQPWRWPGGLSGVTIGYGYDLGYVTVDQFETDWGPHLDPVVLEHLRRAVGKRGKVAAKVAESYRGLRPIPASAAIQVLDAQLPVWEARARATFPGFDALPDPAQAALVSLLYNRGTSMVDRPGSDRRREMRQVRAAVAAGDLPRAAEAILAMRRLWAGQGLDGLLRRREEEARLVWPGPARA